MKRKFITLLIFLALAAAAYFFIEKPYDTKHFMTIRGYTLTIDLANTEYLVTKGLMGRQHLSKNRGMFFVLPRKNFQVFHMKNTVIPLSIAFIRDDGTISQIMDMVPDKWDGKLKEYRSREKVRFALEVNQGWFEDNHIFPGDTFHFSRSIKRASNN